MTILHLSIPLNFIGYTLAIVSCYPGQRRKKIEKLLISMALLYALLTLISPSKVFITFLPVMHVLILFMVIYWVFICLHAIKKNKKGATYNLAVILLLMFVLSLEMLYANGLIKTFRTLPIAVALLGVTHVYILVADYYRLLVSFQTLKYDYRKEKKELNAVKNVNQSLLHDSDFRNLNQLIEKGSEISYIEKEGREVVIFSHKGEEIFRSSSSLKSLVESLSLVQCSKQSAVKISQISEPLFEGNNLYLLLTNQRKIKVGPKFKENILSYINNMT